MAKCVRCGRELPGFSTGELSVFCPECRSLLANQPAAGTAVPAPRVVSRRWSPLTSALVGINVAVFGAMTLSGVSLVAPTTRDLLVWGANFGPLSLGAQPWRTLTANYVHIGIIHIFFNMWCLWNLGFLAERIFDRWTYFLIYTACGIGGSLASLWVHPTGIGAGASGAIFGIAGALIAALYLGHLPIPKSAMRGTLRSLVAFAVYNLFFGGVVAGIDNAAHVGGLVTGLALGAAFSRHLMVAAEERARWRWYVFVVTALLLFLALGFLRRHYQAPQ